MNLTDVTIIIPLFVPTTDHAKWAVECIQSALSEKCPVVVYNDGSPTEFLNYVMENAKGAEYYEGVGRKGVGHTRNRAAEHARTPLILPLDCDDKLVPGTVAKMLKHCNGKPVYTDFLFFGAKEGAYKLLDFSCDALRSSVGLATVTVLHSRKQWHQIGGWNEELPLYEDGEYNARLMGNFCGIRIPEPLIMWRQHPSQRSKNPDGKRIARMVHSEYINNINRTDFMCCGKNKSNQNTQPTANIMSEAAAASVRERNTKPNLFHLTTPVSQSTSLPGATQSRVKARYVGGKGKGAHYYAGPNTRFRYKVQYGQELEVDAGDVAWDESQVNLGGSLFLALEQRKISKPEEKVATAPKFFRKNPGEDVAASREPRGTMTKEPVLMVPDFEAVELPDITNMTIQEIKELNLTAAVAEMLIQIEASNKNRTGAIAYLQLVIDED